MKTLTHQQFIEQYKSGEISVLVNKNRAGDFVLSKFADKYNKPAHLFWTWLGIIIGIPLTIVLLFVRWPYAIASFIVGAMINGAARKTAAQFVLQNMLESEEFWNYVLLHKGAEIVDKDNNKVTSAFLYKMEQEHNN